MRKGSANTARRTSLHRRADRPGAPGGATGEIVVRVDSGFWSNDTIATLGRLNVRYTMAVRTNTTGVAGDRDDRRGRLATIDYTPDGEAQVAETTCVTGYDGNRRPLIVRRTRLTDPASDDCGRTGGTTRS